MQDWPHFWRTVKGSVSGRGGGSEPHYASSTKKSMQKGKGNLLSKWTLQNAFGLYLFQVGWNWSPMVKRDKFTKYYIFLKKTSFTRTAIPKTIDSPWKALRKFSPIFELICYGLDSNCNGGLNPAEVIKWKPFLPDYLFCKIFFIWKGRKSVSYFSDQNLCRGRFVNSKGQVKKWPQLWWPIDLKLTCC